LWSAIEIVLENGGDALVGERPDGEGTGRDGLGAGWGKPTKQAQHAEAGAKARLGMRTVGEPSDYEAFCVRADRARPPLEALRRPCGVASMRARHVVRIGAVARAAVATLMGGDALGVVEHLDGAAGDAHIDLSADQRVRPRVVAARDLGVRIET